MQLSGRRWVCNVIGHYDHYLQNSDPSETWVQHQNPLKIYGTQERWNIVPSHCNSGLGKEILLPKLFKYRPAIVLTRHPAKIIYSHYRGRKEKDPNFVMPLDIFIQERMIKFLIYYYNTVYSCIGQKNKHFINYNEIYAEQFSDNHENWSKIIRFVFGSIDDGILRKSIQNNIATLNPTVGVKKYIRTEPSKMGKLSDEEEHVWSLIHSELNAKLAPNVRELFVTNGYL